MYIKANLFVMAYWLSKLWDQAFSDDICVPVSVGGEDLNALRIWFCVGIFDLDKQYLQSLNLS